MGLTPLTPEEKQFLMLVAENVEAMCGSLLFEDTDSFIEFDCKKHVCSNCGSSELFGKVLKHLISGNYTAQCGDCGHIDCYME